MSACRLCDVYTGQLIKYGVRHYAHPECGLKKWGAAFFDRLTPWQLSRFPVIPAKEAGLYDELARRVLANPPESR